MKTSVFLVSGFVLSAAIAHSAPPESAITIARNQASITRPTVKKDESLWTVRAEVLMVAALQDKLLSLLPDLRDPKKIDVAVEELLAAINRKEATLTGYPVVTTVDRLRGVSETITEKRYATEFEPPTQPQTSVTPSPTPAAPPVLEESPIPAAFETRNVGVTLEIEPHVSSHGDFIRMLVVPQRVELLGFDAYNSAKTASGKIVKIDQPQFFTSKVNTEVTVQSGQRQLIGVHLLTKPGNYMEVFILQAWAFPIK